MNQNPLKFSPTPRFEPIRTEKLPPGPGQYVQPEATKGSGQYYLSKFKNSGVGFFGHDKRNTTVLLSVENPGPGTYEQPTDFGYLTARTPKKLPPITRETL